MSIITWQFGYFPPAWAWAHCIAFSPHHAPHTTHCTALYCIIISFDASLRLQLLLSRCTSHVSCGPRPQARAVLLHLLPLGILWGCPTLRCFCAWDDTRDTGPRYGIYPWSLASASFHTKHQQPGRRIYSRHVLPSGQLVTGEVSLVLPSRTLASCKLHVLPHAAALLASPAPGPSPFPLPPPPHANPHRLAASPHLTLHHLRPICVNTPPPPSRVTSLREPPLGTGTRQRCLDHAPHVTSFWGMPSETRWFPVQQQDANAPLSSTHSLRSPISSIRPLIWGKRVKEANVAISARRSRCWDLPVRHQVLPKP